MNLIQKALNKTNSSEKRSTAETTGLCIPPNTFAHEVNDKCAESTFEELELELPVMAHSDKNLGGDPFDAVQLGRTNERLWLDEEEEWYTSREELLHVSTLGGTGYLSHQSVGVPRSVDPTVDVVDVLVGSDNVARTRQAQTTVPQVLAYQTLGRGTILLSNRSTRTSKHQTVEEVAKLITTLAREDLADLQHYTYTGYYDSIAVGENDQSKPDFARNMIQLSQKEPWLDPQDWCWWEDTPSTLDDVLDTEEQRAFIVVPPGYEDLTLNDSNINVNIATADVEEIHVVVLTRVEREWVKTLRTGGRKWLRERIGSGDRYDEVWQNYIEKRWDNDPLNRFEELCDTLTHE